MTVTGHGVNSLLCEAVPRGALTARRYLCLKQNHRPHAGPLLHGEARDGDSYRTRSRTAGRKRSIISARVTTAAVRSLTLFLHSSSAVRSRTSHSNASTFNPQRV